MRATAVPQERRCQPWHRVGRCPIRGRSRVVPELYFTLPHCLSGVHGKSSRINAFILRQGAVTGCVVFAGRSQLSLMEHLPRVSGQGPLGSLP